MSLNGHGFKLTLTWFHSGPSACNCTLCGVIVASVGHHVAILTIDLGGFRITLSQIPPKLCLFCEGRCW